MTVNRISKKEYFERKGIDTLESRRMVSFPMVIVECAECYVEVNIQDDTPQIITDNYSIWNRFSNRTDSDRTFFFEDLPCSINEILD